MSIAIILCITAIIIVGIICYTNYKLNKSDRVNDKVDSICNDVSWIKTDIKAFNLIYDDIVGSLNRIEHKLNEIEE